MPRTGSKVHPSARKFSGPSNLLSKSCRAKSFTRIAVFLPGNPIVGHWMHVNAAAARGLSRGNKRKRDEDRRDREKIFHRKKESLDGESRGREEEKRDERQMRRIDMDRGEGVRKTNSRCIGNLKDQRPLLARSYSEGCSEGWILFIFFSIPTFFPSWFHSLILAISPSLCHSCFYLSILLPGLLASSLCFKLFCFRFSLLLICIAFNLYCFQFLLLPISIAFYLR